MAGDSAWRVIGAWAVGTYRANPCGDLNGGGHQSRLGDMGSTWNASADIQWGWTLTSVIILPLRFRIKITVSLESYGADCKIVAKVVTDLDKIIMALNFMTRCSWLRHVQYKTCYISSHPNINFTDVFFRVTGNLIQQAPISNNRYKLSSNSSFPHG